MVNNKQILILEDLGVSKELFDSLIAKIPYSLVWNIDDANMQNLEGVITIKSKVDSNLLNSLPNVKFIAVAFAGYDCVDMQYCKQNNIAIYNVPTYSTNSVAELTVGLAISLLREIPKSDKIIRIGKWNLKPGIELHSKTIGIVGTGGIGQTTAKYFKTMGCNIIGWARSKRNEFEEIGSYTDSLIDLCSTADIICLHLPLTADTNGIIAKPEIAAMKTSAYIINVARGNIVDENALISALKENRIAGAAVDVFAQEPINKDNEFLKLSNVILTPHIAYKTEEALLRRAAITIDNIMGFVNKNEINRVG